MAFFEKEKELFVDYWKSTSLLLKIIDVILPLLSLIGSVYGYIHGNTLFLLSVIIAVVAFFVIIIYRMKRNYINIKNLYLDEETFLSSMIRNITEVQRLKKKDNINNVNVKSLDINYEIYSSSNNSIQSDMNVTWKIHCKAVDRDLLNYHLVCSKSESMRDFNPTIDIREFNENYSAIYANHSNGLFNHISLNFKKGKLYANSEFEVTMKLYNYYRFMWNDCEVLILNASMYGNSVEKITASIIFKDSRIANRIISVYEVKQNNFKRILIQQNSCQLDNGSDYKYSFEYDKKTADKVFIFVIPKN